MTVAVDFDDLIRENGGDAVRRALAGARHVDDGRPAWPAEPASPPLSFQATPFTWRDPATIPRRQNLYGFELRRKQVSCLVSPGAIGKTTFKVGRAICMATGKEYFGHRVWNGPHRVWLWNLEDELEEVEKTVHAFLKLWSLTPEDLGGRLFIDGVDSASTRHLKLAVEDRAGGFRVQRPVSDALVEELLARQIDYLDVDPFVSSHSVEENNNGAIDAVAKEWVSVAHRANCAANLTHHVRKPNGSETTAYDARGAVALINAARSVLVLSRMTRETAQEFRIPECDRKRYISVYDDKNNKAPPAARAEWYEFVSVGLGNGDDTGPEDSIGALQTWQAPDAFGGVSATQLLNIQREVHARPAESRKHPKARGWVGKQVAYVLGRNLDEEGESRRIEKMIDTWCANGALRTVERLNEKREKVEYVEVGQWADPN